MTNISLFNTLSRLKTVRDCRHPVGQVSKLLQRSKLKLLVTAAAKDADINDGTTPPSEARPHAPRDPTPGQDPLARKLLQSEYLEGETTLWMPVPARRADFHKGISPH